VRRRIQGPAAGRSFPNSALAIAFLVVLGLLASSPRELLPESWYGTGVDAGVRGATVLAVLGQSEIDLSEGILPEGAASLQAGAILGQVTVRIPRDWRVESDGAAVLGKFRDLAGRAPEDDRGAPLLRVHGLALLGAVTITH
jgi:hypothetical protein